MITLHSYQRTATQYWRLTRYVCILYHNTWKRQVKKEAARLKSYGPSNNSLRIFIIAEMTLPTQHRMPRRFCQ